MTTDKNTGDGHLREQLNIVPFVSVEHMMKLVGTIGMENVLMGMISCTEEDFKRWQLFDKMPRIATHSATGVIELMPTSDGELYAFKYVNGHPKNVSEGLQTVTAFGVLSTINNGYPVLLSEMTILTALRTAATSALAAKYLVRAGAHSMAIIGNGAQAEFQAVAFKTLLGIKQLRLYDTNPAATDKCVRNLQDFGFNITVCESAAEAVKDVDIITTATAGKLHASVLHEDEITAGVHVNAVGGDCPGKTELNAAILQKSDIFVEYTPQTRIEGEIQLLDDDHPVQELWQVIRGEQPGRRDDSQITLFDSVGFAIEDFSVLRYVRAEISKPNRSHLYTNLDMIADPDEPRDLFGMLLRAGSLP